MTYALLTNLGILYLRTIGLNYVTKKRTETALKTKFWNLSVNHALEEAEHHLNARQHNRQPAMINDGMRSIIELVELQVFV